MTANVYTKFETFPEANVVSKLHVWLAKVGNAIFSLLLAETPNEPTFTQIQGKDGELYWKICDPRTGETFTCMNDFEVMECLDSNRWRL